MKSFLKRLVARILGWQVRRLQKRKNFKVVATTGSIGKTSTKLAVAHVLGQKFKVRFQQGNYNDPVTVPLVFFGRPAPNIFNPLAWLAIFVSNELALLKRYTYDVVVIEVGTDHPGEIGQHKHYLNADISLITAITPEHMEYFKDLNAVAREEFSVSKMSGSLLVNKDLVDDKYLDLAGDTPIKTYAVNQKADFKLENIKFKGDEASFEILHEGEKIPSSHDRITEPQLYSVAAASAVSLLLGLSADEIDAGIKSIPAVNGRMQFLNGVKQSTIIDDTYNASPEAMRAALDTLYRLEAPQKIAVLGNMNELGDFSRQAHEEIGKYCDPKKLDLVVTLGPDANLYLALAAEARGCKVVAFDNPYQAGQYIKPQIEPGAVILIKGSQNNVYAEETVKLLLNNPADVDKLVRQSPNWLKIKQRNFPPTKS